MLKSFFFLFLCLFLMSCGKGGSGGAGNSQHQEALSFGSDSQLSDPRTPAPTAAQTFETNIKLLSMRPDQEAKAMEAADLIKKVVASDEFKNRVVNFTYNGQKAFVDNKGLTNVQIYKIILEASENLMPAKNNTMDLTVQTYSDGTNVIGYTTPTANQIWVNTKYFDSFTPAEVAGNMFHEWLHKLGFDHAFQSTPSRPYSVPYAIGYIMRDMAAKI